MNPLYNYVYTEAQFEEIQKKFDGKAEYDNGYIFLALNTSIRHNEIKSNILASLILFLKSRNYKAYDKIIGNLKRRNSAQKLNSFFNYSFYKAPPYFYQTFLYQAKYDN